MYLFLDHMLFGLLSKIFIHSFKPAGRTFILALTPSCWNFNPQKVQRLKDYINSGLTWQRFQNPLLGIRWVDNMLFCFFFFVHILADDRDKHF